MQLADILWIGLWTFPQAFSLDSCTREKFGYKSLIPSDPNAYFLCLGFLGNFKNKCPEEYVFNVREQKCAKVRLFYTPRKRVDTGTKNEFNINQIITFDRPLNFNIFGYLWNNTFQPPLKFLSPDNNNSLLTTETATVSETSNESSISTSEPTSSSSESIHLSSEGETTDKSRKCSEESFTENSSSTESLLTDGSSTCFDGPSTETSTTAVVLTDSSSPRSKSSFEDYLSSTPENSLSESSSSKILSTESLSTKSLTSTTEALSTESSSSSSQASFEYYLSSTTESSTESSASSYESSSSKILSTEYLSKESFTSTTEALSTESSSSSSESSFEDYLSFTSESSTEGSASTSELSSKLSSYESSSLERLSSTSESSSRIDVEDYVESTENEWKSTENPLKKLLLNDASYTIAGIDEISNCTLLPNGVYLRYPKSCKKFYICANKRAIYKVCPSNLYFDILSKICKLRHLVDCSISIDPNRSKAHNWTSSNETSISGFLNYNSTTTKNVIKKIRPLSNRVSSLNKSAYTKELEKRRKETETTTICSITNKNLCNENKQALSESHQYVASYIERSQHYSISLAKRKVVHISQVNDFNAKHYSSVVSTKILESTVCRSQRNGIYLRDQNSCSKFYICANGRPILRSCPSNLYFDIIKKSCNYPHEVDCQFTHKQNRNNHNPLIHMKQKHKPELMPQSGRQPKEFTLVSVKAPKTIMEGLPQNHVVALSRFSNSNRLIVSIKKPPGSKLPGVVLTGKDILRSPTRKHPSKTVLDLKSEEIASSRTSLEDKRNTDCSFLPNGAFIRDQIICSQFYVCVNGLPIPHSCPSELSFDIKKRVCNLPTLVDCTDGRKEQAFATKRPSSSNNNSIRPSNNDPDCKVLPNGAFLRHPTSSGKFYVCRFGRAIQRQCPTGLYIDIEIKSCKYPSRVKVSRLGALHPPLQANNEVSDEYKPNCNNKFDGATMRDSKMCNKYYMCTKGVPISHFCAPGKWFDLNRQLCDQKYLVNCPC